MLRKAIDYFCHIAKAPEFLPSIQKNDKAFTASEFYPKMRWLQDVKDDIYDPEYTDMLRVAFTSEFGRGKLSDLVALLSGRNFETKKHEEAIAEKSFHQLKEGIIKFINQTHFERFVMILRSAGFVTSDLIGGYNAVNFAYIVYLRGKADNIPSGDLETIVRRWYAMSILKGRYSGTPETAFDSDIRQIGTLGLRKFVRTVVDTELAESFWTGMLPQQLNTSSIGSPYFLAFQAAQVKLNDKGFLSRDIAVTDLILNRADVHHLYPKKHLKDIGLQKGKYNQIANFALAQSEINIAIGAKPPEKYFSELLDQCSGGKKKYGNIEDYNEMRRNLRRHCIPDYMLDGEIPEYDVFLEDRRKLMALKMKKWFESL